MIWLAWKTIRAGMLKGSEDAKPASFTDGALLLVLNPKAYIIIALMFTQFLSPSPGGEVASVLLITTVFTMSKLFAFSIWALARQLDRQPFLRH